MIEGLLIPPNVRNHGSYDDSFDSTKAKAFLDELDGFDAAVVMGVPEPEFDEFSETVEEALNHEAFEGTEIYAYPGLGDSLDRDYDEIDYDRMGSRIGDIEWMNDEFSADEDVAVFSWDYNVRTGEEIDHRMEDHDTFGQFALDFDDFSDFTVGNYLKGLLPGQESFKDEAEDTGKGFSYSIPEAENSPVIVFNAPFSDDVEDYNEKMRSEAFRNGLAKLPYGQRMKDLGKRGLDRVLGGFEY